MRQKISFSFSVSVLFLLIGVFLVTENVSAATYYLSTVGNDSNSCAIAQSVSSAKQTFSSAKACLAPGDVLVIRDGTYSGSSNAFSGLPNGSASGGYITFRAENEGNVIVTAGLQMDNSNQYLIFQGLRFQDAGGRGILGNHLKFFRNEFKGGCASGNCVNTQIGTNDVNTTADILLEDTWVHGNGGRYSILVYNSNRVILRRVVVRHDGNWTDTKGDPEAGITFYNSSNSFTENVIILDSNLTYHAWQSAFYSVYNTASPQSTSNDAWLGVISLNNLSGADGAGLRFDGNGGQTGHQIQDAVLWDASWGLNVGYNTSVSLTATRLTIGRNSGSSTGIAGQSSGTKTISNVRLFNATVSDVSVSGTAQGKPTYLPTQLGGVGANIVNRIGTSGTLYGETGYNTDTGQSLWPFPNEVRIKKEMCTDAGVTRGFCSDTSLTHYIMNYLGNGDPYSAPDTTPPTSPTSLSATSPSQSSITVSWNPATDNVGVTGYIIERCQGTGCSNFTQVGTPTSPPFTDSNLTPNTFYNYHVRATDAAGNLSGWSNVVGATTQAPDTTLPTAPGNLQLSIVSSSNINLTWTASTDNVAVTGYKVERCAGASCTNFTQVGTPTANSYSDTGLTTSTTYRYRVRAIDAALNNSPYSSIASATTPETPPLSVNLIMAYNFNENTGTTATDLSGNNRNGTLTGGVAWTTGRNNSGVSFDGTNDVITLGTQTLPANFTISAWVNNPNNQQEVAIAFGQNRALLLFDGTLSFWDGALRSFGSVPTNTWRHIAITYDGTNLRGYLDGNSSGSPIAASLSSIVGPALLGAGYTGTGEGGYFSGILDDVRIYNTALTQTEIQTDMNTPLTQPTSTQPCNTVTTANFSQSAYNSYGAPFDAFQTSTNLVNTQCNSADTHTINLTTGVTGDTTRIIYTKGYWYDAVTTAWRQYTGTCTGALNGEWCQGSVSATITDPNISTASAANPTYLVGMTCSVQGGSWKCGCRDTSCTNFSWQIQGAGM